MATWVGETPQAIYVVKSDGVIVESFGGGSGGTSSTDESAFTAGSDSGTPVMGLYEASPTSLSDGQVGVLGATTGRALKVAVQNTVTVDASGTAVPVTDNGGALTVDNGGTFAVQAAQSGTWNIGTVTAVTAISNALPAGTNAIGKLAANSGVDIGDVDVTSVTPGTGATALGKAEDAAHSSGDVGVMALAVRAASPTERSAGPTDGDYEPLAVNEVGAQWTTLTPSANGGCSTFMASGSDGSSILVATAQAAKASAGVLYGYYAYNPEAAVTFVHFYNTAQGSVTVGTTNPLFTIAIPAGAAANLALPYGIAFSTAITVAATTTAGGNTAPGTGVSLVVWYK